MLLRQLLGIYACSLTQMVSSLFINDSRVVSDVFPYAYPAHVSLLSVFLRIQQHFHAIIEGRLWFLEVDYVNLICAVLASVAHAEVKPLGDVSGTMVWLQVQVILVPVYLHCSP